MDYCELKLFSRAASLIRSQELFSSLDNSVVFKIAKINHCATTEDFDYFCHCSHTMQKLGTCQLAARYGASTSAVLRLISSEFDSFEEEFS